MHLVLYMILLGLPNVPIYVLSTNDAWEIRLKWKYKKDFTHFSEGGKRKLEQEVEAIYNAHVAGLNGRQILKHEVPYLVIKLHSITHCI